MSLVFTNYHPLEALVSVKITGELNPQWDERYQRLWCNKSGYSQPSTGSGFGIVTLPLLDGLPGDIQMQVRTAQDNDGNGWMYVIRSRKYNVLYVGITNKDLATGLFGSGRFSHHLRKLLAAGGSVTNHTAGWREHAIARYRDVVSASSGDPQLNVASLLWGDLCIAIAHTPTPNKFERFVLDKFEEEMSTQGISVDKLNRAASGKDKCHITFPCNSPSSCSDGAHGAIVTTKTIEVPVEISSAASVQFEEGEQYDNDLMINDEYKQYIESMDEKNLHRFQALLAWARKAFTIDRNEGEVLREKRIKGYTNQPRGYSGIPMVLFAPLNDQGRAKPDGWVARIPLKCTDANPMTVVLPTRLKAETALEGEIIRGIDENFAPLDVDDFLRRPKHYVTN